MINTLNIHHTHKKIIYVGWTEKLYSKYYTRNPNSKQNKGKDNQKNRNEKNMKVCCSFSFFYMVTPL